MQETSINHANLEEPSSNNATIPREEMTVVAGATPETLGDDHVGDDDDDDDESVEVVVQQNNSQNPSISITTSSDKQSIDVNAGLSIRDKILLQQRSSHDIARDTKRILEICYGKSPTTGDDAPKDDKDDNDDDGTPTTTQQKTIGKSSTKIVNGKIIHGKRKRKKKKKTKKKKNRSSKVTDSNSSTNVDETTEIGGETTTMSDSSTREEERLKIRQRRRKKTSTSGTTTTTDDTTEGTEVEATESSKKKTKKKKSTTSSSKNKKSTSSSKKKKNKKKPIERDAAGRIIRRRRRMKDRHRVVKKELIKRGKDAKIDLPTITENDFDDDEDDYTSSSEGEEDHHDLDVDDDDDDDRSHGSLEDDSTDATSDDDEDDDENCDDDYEDDLGEEEDDDDSDDEDENIGDDDEVDETSQGELVGVNGITPDPIASVAKENSGDPTAIYDTDTELSQEENQQVDLERQASHVAQNGMTGSSVTDSTDKDGIQKESVPFSRNKRLICFAAVIALAVAAAVIIVFFLVIERDDSNNSDQSIDYDSNTSPAESTPISPPTTEPSPDSSSPEDDMIPTSSPSVVETGSPTSFFNEISSTCQTLNGRPGVQVFEADDPRSTLRGNLTIGTDYSGFCADGYVTNFVDEQSRLLIADVQVPTTGFYTFVLRYSTEMDEDDLDDDTFEDPTMTLDIDGNGVGKFNLLPTGNSTVWLVDEISDVLLKEGTYRFVLWSTEESSLIQPNVDWLALQLDKPATRFEYLSTILTPILPDVSESSPAQIDSLIWMSSDDPFDWFSLPNDEIIERYALIVLYFSTNGDLWSNNNEWLSERHICDWYGILCWQGSRVTDLFLDDNSLFGTLPTDLFLLEELVSFSAASNSLEGSLRSEIGNINRLERLMLDANFLTGTLPETIGSFSNLTYLSLESNALSGPIPDELYTLSRLEFLSLASNRFINGTLGDTISNLAALRELNYQNNQLSETLPSQLGLLTSLTVMRLGLNSFTGTIPSELAALSDLILLDLSNNQLTGIVPPELELLNNTVIDTFGNNIIDT